MAGELTNLPDGREAEYRGSLAPFSTATDVAPYPTAAQTTATLRRAGRDAAKDWTVPGEPQRKQGHRVLKEKWSRANDSIHGFWESTKLQDQPDSPPSRAADWLANSNRLLATALKGTEESADAAAVLPEIQDSGRGSITRAYAAAAAYLSACKFEFDAASFIEFYSALQEVQSLKISELRALKPFLQLVALEEVAEILRPLLTESGTTSGEGDDHEVPVRLKVLVGCLRDVDRAPWSEILEKVSEVDRVLREDSDYLRMDPESRALYVQQVEELGRFSETPEPDIVRRAIAMARAAQLEWSTNPRIRDRRGHVGYYLIGQGREWLEKQIGYQPPFATRLRQIILAWPEIYYFVGIEILTFATIAFLLIGARAPVSLVVAFLLLFLPASNAAWDVMNRITSFFLTPRALPKLDFSEGIPAEFSTLVVVPTLLIREAEVRRLVGDLEVRYLANRDANLYFALLTDSPDSRDQFDHSEELVNLCSQLIQDLNRKYSGEGPGSFLFFHRYRVFNPREGAWMGWERKRGKILDLNKLLRGDYDAFPIKAGDLSILPKIKYVITLDTDTQLPRGAAARLIGTLAHPLNRAVIDPRTNTVVEGYGLLQPRVGISVRSASRSLLATIYSGQTGTDPYSQAISDVYQDLFGEGNFAGKGIYEVDVFRQVLEQRFPRDAILSHDLIEGTYTRAGFVSDVEVIDDYPTRFSAYSRRKHRWVRGDWQIMRWLFPRVPSASGEMVPNPLSVLSRWKILDNIRRSLQEIATFVLLLAGWFYLPGSPRRWTLAVVVLLLIPAYLQMALSLLGVRPGRDALRQLGDLAEDFVTEQINVFFQLAFLSYQALVNLDAIIRTVVRVTITRRKLLEWETAAQAEVETRKTPVDLYLTWTPWLSLLITGTLALINPHTLTSAAPLLILWACSGTLARWLNRPLRSEKTRLSARDEEFLRGACLRTWQYFKQTVTAEGTGLVPDRLQETPSLTAHKVSPTNLGMQLDAQLAAYELGYLTLPEFVQWTEKALKAAKSLRRFRGHFVNWYDTQTLEPLDPLFVSSVDNGNLVCSLWILKQGCLRAIHQPLLRKATWLGLCDHLNILEEHLSRLAPESTAVASVRKMVSQLELLAEHSGALAGVLPEMEASLGELVSRWPHESLPGEELRWWSAETLERVRAVREMVEQLLPWLSAEHRSLVELLGEENCPWDVALPSMETVAADLDGKLASVAERPETNGVLRLAAMCQKEQLPLALSAAEALSRKLALLAAEADRLVQEMDFRFLFNPRRKLLSIGYNVQHQRVEESCYDLLASEARSAVFAAVAKGEIPQQSWFHLERAHFRWGEERVLVSWSGTMFEYLMPALWFKRFPHTLLDRSLRAVVRCHRKWGEKKRIPWGVSEAAYSGLDTNGYYLYRAFGVPGLALDKDIPEDLVVSPYSTFLALLVDPISAVRNLQLMAQKGWLGKWGFYESIDFTPERVRAQDGYELVRCWMAHHQGMSLLAAYNLLSEGALQSLFHSEPAVAATELLLHEKATAAARADLAISPTGDRAAEEPAAEPPTGTPGGSPGGGKFAHTPMTDPEHASLHS